MTDDPQLSPRPETSLSARPDNRGGWASIKAEYIIKQTPVVDSASTLDLNSTSAHLDLDDVAEGRNDVRNGGGGDPRDSRDAGDNGGKRRKADKKAKKGQNKAREFPHVREAGAKMCRSWELTGVCSRGGDEAGCKFAHDWIEFFRVKNADVDYNPLWELKDEEPYVVHLPNQAGERVVIVGGEVGAGTGDEIGKTISQGTVCPVYLDLGYCPFGWRCRFLGGHVRKVVENSTTVSSDADADGHTTTGTQGGEGSRNDGLTKRLGHWELTTEVRREGLEGADKDQWRNRETNWADPEVLIKLRTGQYKYPFTKAYLQKIEPERSFDLEREIKSLPPKRAAAATIVNEEEAMNEESELNNNGPDVDVRGEERGYVLGEGEAIDTPLRPEEKRRLNWEGGLYLAPLTTVGNLPFRRLCGTYGATITVSEMALAQPLVVGHNEEWALVRKHESEKMFGIQLAGGYPNRMVAAAELIRKEIGSGVDFVDVNLGCPIDLVFNQGAGSALMDSAGRLGKILIGMNRALGDIPLTVKFRTGVASNKPNAHKLIPRFVKEWGASALTLHGRSRQQRYSKLADWDYIKTCATTLRETLADEGLPPVPIFGNGDCFSAQSYHEEKEKSGVDGVMIARGALIKPWIFTEIAEKREWDISATERLDGIRKFAEFGLTHWGSDTQGLNITRRFLCEALSFQHRYIPIGLLETLPPKLNERPPAYKGRSELETLLSSPFAGDWVKISEMFLGKCDGGFKFLPKHKSNAYDGEVAQG